MRSRRSALFMALMALALFSLAAAAACGDDDDAGETAGPTPTPFSLGSTLTVRGQQLTLPQGVAYINQTPDCQQEANASSADCLNDLKMLVRGDSYILFDAAQPRVVARRIEPEDESDFRPLLGIISGTTGGESPAPDEPAPTQ